MSEDDLSELKVEEGTPRPIPFKRRRTIREPHNDTINKNDHGLILDTTEINLGGKIKAIKLVNFLCHEHLNYEPTDQINLIQGRNGSGKSSIVAAIIAGLGATSKNTDRGNLKNLILWGKGYAVVEIQLYNKGYSSFKPDVYGESIIIERRITPKLSTYKIKNSSGNIVSQKKGDLVRILENFSIFVDNPVVMLTQEKAKTFLSSSNPRDLFKFFMLSTGLQHLKDDYNTLILNLEECKKLIKYKLENLNEHEVEVKKWMEKVKKIQSLGKIRERILELRREMQWAEIAHLEKELETSKIMENKYQTQIQKIDSELQKLNEEKKDLEQQKKTLEQNLAELAEVTCIFEKEFLEKKKELSQAKEKLSKNTAQLRGNEREYHSKEEDVAALSQKLQTDHNEAYSKYESDVRILQEKKDKLHLELQKMKHLHDTELTHVSNLENIDEAQNELELNRQEEKAIFQTLKKLEDELRSLSQTKDPHRLFGQQMPSILSKIQTDYQKGAFTRCPIGPLGAYIKVKDRNWTHVAERVLGNLMTSFLVNDARDLAHLKQILRSYERPATNDPRPTITVTKYRNQRHDVRRYEVIHPSYPSLWSILDVSDVQVANAIIDQRGVESILLIPTSLEAASILKNSNTVPRNCSKAYTIHGDTYYPDPDYRVYSGDGNRRTKYLQISVEDKRRDLKENIASTKKELEKIKEDIKPAVEKINDLSRLNEESQKKMRSILKTTKDLQSKLFELDNIDIPAPPDVFQLQKDLAESKTQLASIGQKVSESEEQVKESKENYMQVNKNLEQFKVQMKEYTAKGNYYQTQHDESLNEMTENKRLIIAYNRKRSDIENNMKKESSKQVNQLEEKIEAKITALTNANSERKKTRRKVSEIERELNSLKEALESQESAHGNIEAVTSTWKEKKDRYEAIKKDVIEQKNYLSKLNSIISHRLSEFKGIKKFQLLFLKSAFTTNLDNHSLKGKIDLDYDKEQLKIIMIKGSTEQSLAMMSGGERSYATVCFISALWTNIQSPIRILDEFDIFMDIVLRRKAIDMLISNVMTRNQYIFVSPLDYNISNEKITTFRVPSPERKKRRLEN